MADLAEVFRYAFMQRAFAAGALIAVMCALLGVFVVQRRLSFLGDGLAHAAFGGLGLGTYLLVSAGLLGRGALAEPLWIALPFVLLTAFGIALVRDRTRLSGDTAIGVFFAVSVALGVLAFSSIPPDAAIGFDVTDLLFGSILGVTPRDLVVIAVTALLSLIVLIVLWGRLAYATFDPELAQTDGVAPRRLEYLLYGLAAIVIAVSAQVVGIVLMAAYLVIPAASARLVSRSLFRMSVAAVAIGLFSTSFGLVLAFWLGVPSGSTVILLQAALFTVAAVSGRGA